MKRLPLALLTLGASCALHASDAPRRWTPAAIASDQYESTPAFSPGGRELYFFRADRNFDNYRLLRSRCEAHGWSAPEAVPFASAAGVLEADPFVSPDGQRLYYVSARPGPGEAHSADADLDIWFVQRGRKGDWGAPQRLPEPVNSPATELLPRLDDRGRLWFGSDRAGGLGGRDIYVATPDGQGGWQVANAGAPISTAANEYEASPSADGRHLVVVADRGDRSHLYHFEWHEGRWVERGKLKARDDVFQIGPMLSPRGDRVLFAQADGDQSGELFVADLRPGATQEWPPACPPRAGKHP
jgi:Tol biopolymer transport system component